MSRPRYNCRTLLTVDGHHFDGKRWRPHDDPFWLTSGWTRCTGFRSYCTLRRAFRDVRALQRAGCSGTIEHAGRNGHRTPFMRVRTWDFKGVAP